MFSATEFSNLKDANEHIKKLLAELKSTSMLEFQVIHSISESECQEDGGVWEDISKMLMHFLRNLDFQQGYMIQDGTHWDFIDWDEPDRTSLYRDSDEFYVNSSEGLVVINNIFALCENEFPVIVLKKSFWEKHRNKIINLLKDNKVGNDYTAKISPAIYIEIFYQENSFDDCQT
jgi:hypothetical protein